MDALCQICGGKIHPERLALRPQIKSCCHDCAVGIRQQINRASADRHRKRVRETKAGLKPGLSEQMTRKDSLTLDTDRHQG